MYNWGLCYCAIWGALTWPAPPIWRTLDFPRPHPSAHGGGWRRVAHIAVKAACRFRGLVGHYQDRRREARRKKMAQMRRSR